TTIALPDAAAGMDTTSPTPPPEDACAGDVCLISDAGYCGDGVLEGNETCDDGNSVPGDGCSGTCQIEPGWYCPVVGQPCKRLCGDGRLDPGEACDLGPQNGVGGSGCTIDCRIAPGFACGPGDAVAPSSPDASGDGGGAPPHLDAGVVDVDASAAGVPDAVSCFAVNNCGNGRLDVGEQCDTGALNGTGGCTTSCTILPGWRCSQAGFGCLTVCGDAIVAGDEQCDFGTAAGVGGCTANCTVMPGYACAPGATVAAQCHKTTCGDGVKEGLEECDDGNRRPYDGCSPWCTIEPVCSAGTCTAVCGDGQVSPGEQCDDGNTVAGDGCSPTCTVEPGWTCTTVTRAPDPTLVIPILYRDMHYCNATDCAGNSASTSPNAANTPATPANGHPDFDRDAYNVGATPRTGLVSPTLGADNEPVFLSATGNNGTQPILTSAVDYCWWYHDVGCSGAGSANPFAMGVWLDAAGNPLTLTLAQLGGATSYVYQYDNQAFFPINGLGWNDPRAAQNPGWFDDPQTSADCSFLADGGMAGFGQQNFSFTSELHYRFTYQAAVTPPPTFTFTGDDDVWTFVNGHIFADLGGMHDHLTGTITLDAPTAATLGLVDQGIYSIDVFQAERHTCRSTYELTVQDFVHRTSQCKPLCGSALPAVGKQCDLGTNQATGASNNTGGYGGCNPDCTLAPYCGDGLLQMPPEQCDLGASRNTGAYGGCNPNCTLGPYCGDGTLQSPPEQCDLGTANNTGGYGGCNANCMLAPYCGDGILQNPPEQCDQGPQNVPVATAYGQGLCTTACTLAPYCGDGVVQASREQCDNGAQNAPVSTAYGKGQCTVDCTAAPFCGDGIVQAQFGEQCDGTPGCTASCQLVQAM
ncbi:MAG: DUF4215 domain-containing protein, partial [Myxococcales bacterium]|nr:DUF4215 domain-containing protein [Myxococcales bacterium]